MKSPPPYEAAHTQGPAPVLLLGYGALRVLTHKYGDHSGICK